MQTQYLLLLSTVFLAASQAGAQSPPTESTRRSVARAADATIVCWYDAQGQYKGADSADPGKKAGDVVRTPNGGDAAISLYIAAQDGTSCPQPFAAKAPASASAGKPHPASTRPATIICWYNQEERFTGSDSANPGTKAGDIVRKPNGGDYTVGYFIAAPDGTKCPQRLPSVYSKSRPENH